MLKAKNVKSLKISKTEMPKLECRKSQTLASLTLSKSKNVESLKMLKPICKAVGSGWSVGFRLGLAVDKVCYL